MSIVSAPRPAAHREGAPGRRPARPGFVLYVGVPTPHAESAGLVELAETLSEFAREWLPDAETYTALRLVDGETQPAQRTGLAAVPASGAASSAQERAARRPRLVRDDEVPAVGALQEDVAAFRARLAGISPVPRLVIDTRGRVVTVDDREVHLTYKEFELLVHLAQASDRTVTRDELLASVWGGAVLGEGSRTIDVHVRRIREKLAVGHVVTTVRGVGYRFATNAEVVLAS